MTAGVNGVLKASSFEMLIFKLKLLVFILFLKYESKLDIVSETAKQAGTVDYTYIHNWQL